MSQANLQAFQKGNSRAGDAQSLAARSRLSKNSRITIQSAHSRKVLAPAIVAAPSETNEKVDEHRRKILNVVNQLNENELERVSDLLQQPEA